VDEIHAWRESMLTQSEAAVLNLVTDIARTMFGNGLVLEPDVLRDTFTRALSEAKQLGDLLVHLHPADVTILDRAWVENQTASRAARIELVPDPAIRRGGCLVEGQFGQVDARVETKWGIVEQTLNETLTANAKHPTPEGAAI
jgi:flagellar assembly protein FliH